MPYTSRINSLHIRSIITSLVILLRRVILRISRRHAHAKDIRPLLQLLLVVLGSNRPVY